MNRAHFLAAASVLGGVIAVVGCASTGCAGSARDVVPTTHDVQVSGANARGNYAYVARRPLGFVGLSSQDGLGADVAQGAVDRLADKMDGCAAELAKQG